MPILASAPADVAPGVTWLFGGLLAALILCLAFEEKLHAKKSIIAGVFAIVGLFLADAFGLIQGTVDATAGHTLFTLPVYIISINWEVIAIILGSSLFVDITARSGLFTWIALKLTKASGGDPLRLLVFYGAMTVVFSAVLNNVTAMIIVGSLTVVSLGRLERKNLLLGFLLIEALLTNIGGLLTLISSVPNIIVGSAANIGFMEFLATSWFYVLVATTVTIWLGAKRLGVRRLADEGEKKEAARLVATFDETDGIESPGFFRFAAVILGLFIVVIATTSLLPVLRELSMGYVCLAFALIMLLRYRSEADTFYKAIDWDLLGFFCALFIFIHLIEEAQVLHVIGGGLASVMAWGPELGTAGVLVGSAVISSVTDNIPLAAMLAKILGGLDTTTPAHWWAVVFGANLGGNLTPIGSASTLVAVTIMHKHGLKVSFAGFVKMSFIYAVVQIALAIAYVLVFVA